MSNIKQTPLDGALWVAPSYPSDCVTVKKVFIINDKKEAKLYITGLGYFEARINGMRVTEDVLIPPASDYLKRDLSHAEYPINDEMTHRIYYHEFDVRGLLKSGKNVLSVDLGGGWLTQSERIAEGNMAYSDRPMCIFALVTDEGVICSDGSEIFVENEIRCSSLFIGEVIDATFHDDDEKSVITLPHPDSLLTPAIGINDAFIRDIEPRLIFESDGRRVYDVGENISAVVSVTTSASNGKRCTLRFAENIDQDFNLDFSSTGSSYKGTSGEHQIMTDVYIASGDEREFCPRFVWHAFRYFELIADADFARRVTVHEIRARIDVTSTFESSSEGANFLYDAYLRTQLSSYHGSHPSDCPHRERLGYTGDGQICAASAMLLTDTRELYRKWIRDILDCQDKKTGHVQHTAPFQGGGGGPGGWGSAVVTVPYAFVKQYGDLSVLADAFPAIERWISFTEQSRIDGLVARELDGGWCLGDWCYLKSGELPAPFVNTCWFIHTLRLYKEMCSLVKRTPMPYTDTLIEDSLTAVKGEYPVLSHKGTARVYAAWIGIDDAKAVNEYYDRLGHIDCGFLGTDILFKLLFECGGEDVAEKLLDGDGIGSFLYMKRHGATTLWETWSGNNSHSHPMFGAAAGRLFTGLLGIRQRIGSVGFDDVVIAPRLPQKMSHAGGSIMTPHGKIEVSLLRSYGKIAVSVTVPEGVTAVLDLAGEITPLRCGKTEVVRSAQ